MTCPSKEGLVKRLHSGESEEERKHKERGQDANKSEKVHPARAPPPPPPRVMSPHHHHSPPRVMSPHHQHSPPRFPDTQKQQPQKLQTPHFCLPLGLTPSAASETLLDAEPVKDPGKCSPTVARRVLILKDSASTLQPEDKDLSAAVPPKPAPRLSRGNIRVAETLSGDDPRYDDIQNRQRSNSDVCGLNSKTSSPIRKVESTEERGRASLPNIIKSKVDRGNPVAALQKEHRKSGSYGPTQDTGSPEVPKRFKPILPQKPDLVKRHSSMRTANELEKQFKTQHGNSRKFSSLDNPSCNISQGKLEPQWLPTLPAGKISAPSTKSAAPPPPKLVVPISPSKKQDATQQRSAHQECQMIPEMNTDTFSQQQHEAVPPAKPPRTHAHDDYLRVKVVVSQSSESELSQHTLVNKKKQQTSDTCSNRGDAADETKPITIKPRLQHQAELASNMTPPLILKEGVSLYHRPPTRPPPPRRRPHSSDPAVTLSASSINLFENFRSNQTGESAHNHMYLDTRLTNVNEIHHRRASDRLPPAPDFNEFSQKFTHARSLSSECLQFCRVGDGGALHTSSQDLRGADCGAVVDPDGYAVPNAFMRLPGDSQSFQEKNSSLSPRRISKRIKVPSSEAINFNSRSVQGDGITPVPNQNLTKVNKKTMNMVKQKISQAFANVNIAPKEMTSTDECDWEFVDHGQESGEFIVEPAVQKIRIEYCASVRRRSVKGLKRTKDYNDAVYPQLFEYCLVVGLRQLVGEEGYEPYLMHKFPENASANLSVPNFCFPDARSFKPGSTTSLSEPYSFVMTYSDGSHVYGYCRRIQPPDASLPEVVCIISPIDAFNMYNTLLNEIETRRHITFDLASELIAASFGRPLPKPGKVCHIRMLDVSGDLETIFLNRSIDTRLENVNYESPLQHLGTDKLVKVFSSILMERRIILYSNSLSVLTQTIHALSALLYPFHWQHVYIPLLPAEMLDAVCAPMPFIVGMLSSFLPKVLDMDLEEVLIVDLDKKNILKSQGDESTILPKRLQKALKTAINMCKIDAEARNSQWLIVVEAFLRIFIETVGHFSNHIRVQQDGHKIFQKEGFIHEIIPKDVRAFLEWFTETQMFEVFIMNHMKELDVGTTDLFLQRLTEFKESRAESAKLKGLGAKVKNFGKALKTKFQHS